MIPYSAIKIILAMVVLYWAISLTPSCYLAELARGAAQGLIILLLLYLGVLFAYRIIQRESDG